MYLIRGVCLTEKSMLSIRQKQKQKHKSFSGFKIRSIKMKSENHGKNHDMNGSILGTLEFVDYASLSFVLLFVLLHISSVCIRMLAMLHIAYSTVVRVERLYLCFYYVPHCCAVLKIHFYTTTTTNAQRTSCCIALDICLRTLVTNTKIVAVKQRQVKIEFKKCLEDNRRTMKFDLKTKLVPLGNQSFHFCDVNQKPPQVGSTIHSIRKFDMLELENLVSFVNFFFVVVQIYRLYHMTNLPKKNG